MIVTEFMKLCKVYSDFIFKVAILAGEKWFWVAIVSHKCDKKFIFWVVTKMIRVDF